MTTQELIQTYQLAFVNKQIQANPDPNYYVLKFPETSNDLLTEFLYVWNDSSEIDETMISMLEDILNGTIENDYSDANSLYVDIYQTETDFYTRDAELPNFTLPTQDFYDILILWRNFLNEAPLDGSKVGDSNVSA
jgi:hypothetical protein